MGDRAMAEIRTEDGSLFFYTHWTGSDLPDHARAALVAARSRKGDMPYALKIVLDKLIVLSDARDKETGAGVMLNPDLEDEYNSDNPSVLIDLVAWTVATRGRRAADDRRQAKAYAILKD